MKASKQLIEMLTQGKRNYVEISQLFGINIKTARRICQGKEFQRATAMKIAAAFPDSSTKQLFRPPFHHFDVWKKQITKDTMLQNKGHKLSEPTLAEVVKQPAQNNMNNPNQQTLNTGHSSQQHCMFPLCKTPCKSRGLCEFHYLVASDLVRKGTHTWAELEAEGKALPSKKRSRPDAEKWFLSKKKSGDQ